MIILACVFGSALFVRLTRGRKLMVWGIWIGVVFACFITLSPKEFSVEEVLSLVAGGSLVGFIGPEIWQTIRGVGRNCKNSVIKFLSKPKNFIIVLFFLAFLYALYFQPDLLKSLMLMAVVFGALWFIKRSLWKNVFGKK